MNMSLENMDSKVAKQLFLEGGILIVLDVPVGTEFGIDMKSWNTGDRFKGIKMIPAGIHMIHFNAVSSMGDVAPTVSFFYNFKKSEVIVKKWDKNLECISLEPVDENEIARFKNDLLSLDKFLGPYPFDIWERWKSLTSHVNENLAKKLSPERVYVRSALDLVACNDAERPRGNENPGESPNKSSKRRSRPSTSEDKEDDLLPDLKALPGTELRFGQFPEKNYPEGSTPSEITFHSLDLTYTLEKLISQHIVPVDLIGELQFSYICFLAGHSMEAFEYWKKLVSLFCSCEVAVKKYRNLYDGFISVLDVQILEIPAEFLADIVSNRNFVYKKLHNLFRNVQSSNVDGRLKTKVERFKERLTQLYGWDFSHVNSDEEDEAPVVVET